MLRHKRSLLLSLLATLTFSFCFAQVLTAQIFQSVDPPQTTEQPELAAQDDGSQDSVTPQSQDEGSHARIVRLSYLRGGVQIENVHGSQNALMNTPLTEGDRLLTQSDGWAEVQFEDGSTLRMAPGTQIVFSELGRDSKGNVLTALDLDEGAAEFMVAKHEGSQFAVTARNKTMVLNHSGRFRVTTSNSNPLQVVVMKGEVSVNDASSGDSAKVKKNETFTLNASDPEEYVVDNGTEADQLDQWSDEREQALTAYNASSQGYTQSPYQYGESDLNYYGQYYYVPGYGYCWQPNGVDAGWNPYLNGHWVWRPFFGFTWVSSYPWGWMPYRYGNWVYLGGRGWMWQPGRWQNWNRTPVLVHAPPNFHPPVPPVRIPNHPGNPDRNANRAPGSSTGRSPSSGSSLMREGRPHRVFSNVDVDRAPQDRGPGRNGVTPPTSGSSGANENAADTKPSRGNVVVEHRDNAVIQKDKEIKDKDINGTNSVTQPSHQGNRVGGLDRSGDNSSRQHAGENSGAARTPAAPVMRAEPMPSHITTPPPAPHVETPAPRVETPAPHAEAPHVSAPPPAPRVETSAPHAEAPHVSAPPPPPPPPPPPASHPPAESPARPK